MADRNKNLLVHNFDILLRMQQVRIEIRRIDQEENYLVETLNRSTRQLSVSIAEMTAMQRITQSDASHMEFRVQVLQREVDHLQRRITNLRTEKEQYQRELQQLNRAVFEM